MAKMTFEAPTQVVKEMLFQLSPGELYNIWISMQERMETLQMMKLAETAFKEWQQEEDLYSNA
jgi:hypothetical protein